MYRRTRSDVRFPVRLVQGSWARGSVGYRCLVAGSVDDGVKLDEVFSESTDGLPGDRQVFVPDSARSLPHALRPVLRP